MTLNPDWDNWKRADSQSFADIRWVHEQYHTDNPSTDVYKRKPNRREDRPTDVKNKNKCFKAGFERGQGWCLTGDRGSLFQAEGPKTEKEREPTVDSLERGILIDWLIDWLID